MISNIGLLGGSFNPITLGHVNIAKKILNSNIRLNEIWFMPNYVNENKNLLNSTHRINMINIAIENEKNMRLFDFEIKNKLPNETLNTIKLLNKSEYSSNRKFFFIIGLDIANNLTSWENYDELINIISFIVIPRKGYTINKLWFLKGKHKYLNNIVVKNISSTLFKKNYHNEKNNLEEIINKNVLKYIEKSNLY
jgi:nicotinate-nucleotide adenylyltransferase